jgi:hypothetical protein
MNQRMKSRALGVAITGAVTVTLALAAVGCGGSSGAKPPEIPPDALEIDGVANLLLDKTAYTVAAVNGTVKIAYVNVDIIRHTLLIVDRNRIQQGARLEVDKKGDVAIGVYTLAPGQYVIVCDVPGHSATMNATLTVS